MPDRYSASSYYYVPSHEAQQGGWRPTEQDYAGARQSLGFDPSGGGYAAFVAGYADTGAQSVTENWESGSQLSFHLMSINPDGSVQFYTGIDTVINGKIASADVTQTG